MRRTNDLNTTRGGGGLVPHQRPPSPPPPPPPRARFPQHLSHYSLYCEIEKVMTSRIVNSITFLLIKPTQLNKYNISLQKKVYLVLLTRQNMSWWQLHKRLVINAGQSVIIFFLINPQTNCIRGSKSPPVSNCIYWVCCILPR